MINDESSLPGADDPTSLLLLRHDGTPDRCGSFDLEDLDRLSDGKGNLPLMQARARQPQRG